MNTQKPRLSIIAVLFLASLSAEAAIDISGLDLVPSPPRVGTFWFANENLPPFPSPPDMEVPIYAYTNGTYVIDDTGLSFAGGDNLSSGRFSPSEMDPESGGSGDGAGTLRNSARFAGQTFTLLNTNDVAQTDTNLYNACLAFPSDTNAAPHLQIAPYGKSSVLIKANHFDYAGETERDFALLICDNPSTPVWKTVDLAGASDIQDGWLIQGLVPHWKVVDPMYLMVSQITSAPAGFFRAVPYAGPRIELSGAADNDVVSNALALHFDIADLSGTTAEQIHLLINGLDARVSPPASNTVAVDTHYGPDGDNYVEITVLNTNALTRDAANPPADAKFIYSTQTNLTLDFENATFVAFASDTCSPDVGTNYIMFAINQAQNVLAAIKDPASGRTVRSFSGYVPYPAIVQLPWDFAETGGTPYTNDSYSVTFQAVAAGTTLAITNRIDRQGVRTPAGCITTYEEEDPSTTTGSYLNSEASTWVGTLASDYTSLYSTDFGSFTQYSPSDIGSGRDNPRGSTFPYVMTKAAPTNWAIQTLIALTNAAYSDFDWCSGHANGVAIGGGGYIIPTLLSTAIRGAVQANEVAPNWRMRKVAMWGCYTYSPPWTTGGGTFSTWPVAFGIRPGGQQIGNWMHKNAGLFFLGEVPQGPYANTLGGTSVEVAVDFDDFWISGPTPYPGGCDPTYAFSWAVNLIVNINPELDKGLPFAVGFPYLPYTANYESELLINDVTHVKR